MRRGITVFVLLVASTAWTAQSQALNCHSAHTTLEQAICSSPELSAIHTRFSDAAQNAVSSGRVTAQKVDSLKNDVARVCRTSADLSACLASGLNEAIHVLATQSTQSHRALVVHAPGIGESELQSLKQRLAVAQLQFRESGDPENLIATLIALLQGYAEFSQVNETAIFESRAIREKLLAGCADLPIRSKWNKSLQSYGWACPISQIATLSY